MRINTPAVNHQAIDGEIVAINLATGVYYSLAGTAARIWERLDSGATTDAIRSELVAAYGSTDVAAAFDRFLAELQAEGLVVGDEARANPAAVVLPLAGAFSDPVLERFTDMQELLLLDPIHEVDEVGWPVKPS